jgi:alkaline phosphatase
MGCGHPGYDENGVPEPALSFGSVGGRALWNQLVQQQAKGLPDGRSGDRWTLIQDKASFIAMATGKAPGRVLGVAPVRKTLQQGRASSRDWTGDGRINAADEAAAPAFGDPFTAGVPTLAEMARAALNVLDDHPRGFFLMIEGGAVDWAAHENQTGRMIEEWAGFHDAIQAVCDWVEANGGWEENLVIVTADHETGYLQPTWAWRIKDHTNQMIPLFAKGSGADRLSARMRVTDPVRGPTLDNTDIGRVLLELLGRP